MSEITRRDRFRGGLLGLATGDALGTTLEFKPPGTFPPVDDMLGGGPFKLQPGQWTDDTSMALCLAGSLIERDEFDAEDQMQRYVSWWQDGYLSSTGSCFDIGNTVASALSRFIRIGEPYAGSTHSLSAGQRRSPPLPTDRLSIEIPRRSKEQAKWSMLWRQRCGPSTSPKTFVNGPISHFEREIPRR